MADDTGQSNVLTITELIDGDEGLKSKRKLLTITSLILLALTFSGAKVEEANTFVLKLRFDNQNGIAILLVLAIVFLLIRYYNYAKPYHEKLFREWSDRMLEHEYFYWFCDTHDVFIGLVMNKAPKAITYETIKHDGLTFAYHYKCSYFKRSFVYEYADAYGVHYDETSIGWKNYFNVFWLETRYQMSSFFTHRENLDILAPYLIGGLAILSYFFSQELSFILNTLIVSG